MADKVKYEKLEKRLAEISEIKTVVQSVYNSVQWDYNYEFELKQRYTEMLNAEDSEESDIEVATRGLESCEIKIKIYEKVFDYLNSLLQGKA